MKIIYCATPSRMAHLKTDIMDYVTKYGYGPLHPFQALPVDRFENGPIGRDATMQLCCKLIKTCDELWLFGVSEGTLIELCYALNHRIPVVSCLNFDEKWQQIYETLKVRFGDPLTQILPAPH